MSDKSQVFFEKLPPPHRDSGIFGFSTYFFFFGLAHPAFRAGLGPSFFSNRVRESLRGFWAVRFPFRPGEAGAPAPQPGPAASPRAGGAPLSGLTRHRLP